MKLRYLHLSDLHLSYSNLNDPHFAVTSFNQDMVTSSMLSKIKEIVDNGSTLDFVIITGDLAQRGKMEEYQVVLEFCNKLFENTNLPPNRLYIVPGNHDIDRAEINLKHIKRLYTINNQDEITGILTDTDFFPILMRKFANFNSFAEKAMGRKLYDESTYHLVESLSLEKQSQRFKVNLMGLNSCLFAGYDGDDKNNLALGLFQVERALAQLDEKALFSIAFFHHPFSCFHHIDKVIQNRLMNRMDMMLTGHLHQHYNESIHDAAGKAIIIGSGASFESRESQNCFNLVEIDLTNGEGCVQFYKYLHQHNCWKKDTDANPDQEDGHFPITIESIRKNPIIPQKQTPYHLEKKKPETPYDIFISYSHVNSEWIQKALIPTLLQCERSDGERLRIFLHDVSTIQGIEHWDSTISNNIQACLHFLPIFSADFFESEMCILELDWALSRDPYQRNGIIVPLKCQKTEVPFEYGAIKCIDASIDNFSERLYNVLNIQQSSKSSPDDELLKYEPHDSKPNEQLTRFHFIHDYLLPTTFTGRIEEKARLMRLIQGKKDPITNKSASLITIRAIGGIGKSCLIRKVVENFRGESRFQDIIWFSFYQARREDESYLFLKVLEILKPPGYQPVQQELIDFSELQNLRETLCRYLDQNPVLLVLDGVEVIQHTKDQTSPDYGRIEVKHCEIKKLLIHICNQSCSTALVTSRVILSDFSGVSGYLEVSLELFSEAAGVKFLERMNIKGREEEILNCVRILGGHPLCLKSAGKYMKMMDIPASQVERITGNPELFQYSPEGQRINKIIHSYRSELSKDQEHFLKMLGLHPRSVTEKHFSALIEGYNRNKHNKDWIMENIIKPLLKKELIEKLKDANGNISYSAHPLMKFAFSNWFNHDEISQAHEIWAKVTEGSPDLSGEFVSDKNAEALQTYLEIIDHYFEAGKVDAAWEIFRGKNIDYRLRQAGYENHVDELREKFQQAVVKGEWEPAKHDKSWLYFDLEPKIKKSNLPEERFDDMEKELNISGNKTNKSTVITESEIDYINKEIIERTVESLHDNLASHPLLGPVSFKYFLEITARNPRCVFRNIFQVFSDMVRYYVGDGFDEYPDDPEAIGIIYYDCYRLFIENTDHPFFADRLFANRLVNLAKALRQGVQQNKIYIFEGPPGCGKSTFLNNLLFKFEKYANTEEGARYETVWRLNREALGYLKNEAIPIYETILNDPNLEDQDEKTVFSRPAFIHETDEYVEIPCPSHDNPILMIPKSYRREFFDNLFKNDKFKYYLFTEKEYEWVFKDNPCTICSALYKAIQPKLDHPAKVFDMIYARRYHFDRRSGEGVSVFNPGDKPLSDNVLTNEILQHRLDSLLKESNRVRYIFSNYARTNNGIYALMDIKGNNRDRLIELHNIISEGVHKVEHIEENVHSLFLALMGPEDKSNISGIQSFMDRIEYIKISYIMDIRTEVGIYKSIFGKHIAASFLPKVLHNFARVIISSRLKGRSEALLEWISDPKKYEIYCDKDLSLLKMEIYTGHIPDWLDEDDISRFTAKVRNRLLAESELEGIKGFSGRDSIKIFYEFYSTYASDEKPINMSMLVNFFVKKQKELPGLIPDDFLEALCRLYDYNLLQEVKSSLFDMEAMSLDIQDYLFAIIFGPDSLKTSHFSSGKQIISEEFVDKIENILFGPDQEKTEILSFRNDILESHLNKKLIQEIVEGEQDISKLDIYFNLNARYFFNLSQSILNKYFENDFFQKPLMIMIKNHLPSTIKT
jgi:predicted MPP superfamily phosphohydrolase